MIYGIIVACCHCIDKLRVVCIQENIINMLVLLSLCTCRSLHEQKPVINILTLFDPVIYIVLSVVRGILNKSKFVQKRFEKEDCK